MRAARPFQSIAERVDEAFAVIAAANRLPIALVLGKEDYPAFRTWAQQEHGLEIESGDRYRDLPVRLNELVFLSCIELQPVQGLPNARNL